MTIQELFKQGLDRDIPVLMNFPAGVHLNLGCGNKIIPDSAGLQLPEWDAETDQIPYPDESITGIYCYHFLEHINNLVFVLCEMERVLKYGGVINIVTPYYSSQCQWQDIDHKRAFCEETWRNIFKDPYYEKGFWKLDVHACFIMGVVERNICLFTQLVKAVR